MEWNQNVNQEDDEYMKELESYSTYLDTELFLAKYSCSLNIDLQPKSKFECRVCGRRVTGFNYGAYTCTSCKLFFRSTMGKKSCFASCAEYGQCEVNSSSANSCKSCRYKACIAAGMRHTITNKVNLITTNSNCMNKLYSNISHLLVEAHQELATSLLFHYCYSSYNIHEICKNNFKSKFEKFYDRCINLLDYYNENPDDGIIMHEIIEYTNDKHKTFLDVLLLVIYSILFNFHGNLFNELKIFNEFSVEFKLLIENMKDKMKQKKIANINFQIICFIYAINFIDNVSNGNIHMVPDRYRRKLNDFVNLAFRLQTSELQIVNMEVEADTQAEKNLDAFYNINVFLLNIDDIEKLISRHLKHYLRSV